MAYSRWSTSDWYTFWSSMGEDRDLETRDNAVFCICAAISFPSKDLRDDIEGCLEKAHELQPDSDVEELRGYMNQFLADVDKEYPEEENKS